MRQDVYIKFAEAIRQRRPVKTAALPQLSDQELTARQMLYTGHLPAYAAAGLGGLAAGHAFGRGGSLLSRLLQAAAGAGLAYGGYRYLSDPAFRSTVNGYGRQVYDFARPYVQRGWEAVKPVFDKGVANLFAGGAAK